MEDPHNSWVPESLIEVLKSCTRMLRSTSELVRNLQFLSTSGVKQGDNLAPVLFIFVIAVSNTLDKKWDFTTPDFRWFRTLKLEASREDNYAEPITQQECSRSSSPIMSTIRPSFFSAAEK
jgi:hypothetical protein